MKTDFDQILVGALVFVLLVVIAGGFHLDYRRGERRGECRKAAIENLTGTDLALAIQACE
jgi:hypothetical protein